jgi:hypothetical protein
MGEYRCDVRSMFVLFGALQGAVSLEALSVSFSSTRHLGSSPGFAVSSDQLGLRNSSGNRNHDMDDSSIRRQRLMDSELVAGLACVVHRCNGRKEMAEKLNEVEMADERRRRPHDDLATNAQCADFHFLFCTRFSECSSRLCRLCKK